MGVSRKHAVRDHRQHGRASRHHADTGFARNIVGTEHKAGQAHLRIMRLRGQFLGMQDGLCGLDHRPHPDRGIGSALAQPVSDRLEIGDA